jgi:hypothetical protein
MAFSFYGTFTSAQWEQLRTFTAVQKVDLLPRIQWLQRCLLSVGVFQTDYDEHGTPMSFVASPPSSHAAKLLEAYRILGGVPERDMLLRTSDLPVFLTRGLNAQVQDGEIEGGFSDMYSNGRRFRGGQRFDRNLGLRVERLKAWQLESIKKKREHLEYKIKRALDYSDQLLREVELLTRLMADDSGSVADQVTQVELAMEQPGAMNVVDSADDVHGLNIGRVADYTYADALDRAAQEGERG